MENQLEHGTERIKELLDSLLVKENAEELEATKSFYEKIINTKLLQNGFDASFKVEYSSYDKANSAKFLFELSQANGLDLFLQENELQNGFDRNISKGTWNYENAQSYYEFAKQVGIDLKVDKEDLNTLQKKFDTKNGYMDYYGSKIYNLAKSCGLNLEIDVIRMQTEFNTHIKERTLNHALNIQKIAISNGIELSIDKEDLIQEFNDSLGKYSGEYIKILYDLATLSGIKLKVDPQMMQNAFEIEFKDGNYSSCLKDLCEIAQSNKIKLDIDKKLLQEKFESDFNSSYSNGGGKNSKDWLDIAQMNGIELKFSTKKLERNFIKNVVSGNGEDAKADYEVAKNRLLGFDLLNALQLNNEEISLKGAFEKIDKLVEKRNANKGAQVLHANKKEMQVNVESIISKYKEAK